MSLQENKVPQNIFTRRALPADAAVVAAITTAAYAHYVPLLGRQPQPMTADYGQIITENPVWLLCLDEQPVGALVLMPSPDHLLIYNVAVSPAYQKRGLGRHLLAWAEQEAQRGGHTLLRLYTNAIMTDNIALYRRLGYIETGREPYLGSTVVYMEKRLG